MARIAAKRLQGLRDCADTARKRSYAKYSKFKVVAAVETCDGSLYAGANVEVGNYSLTKHAEEVAVLAAIGAGHGPAGKWIKALYIAGGPPCGSCRQFVAEFAAPDAICVFEPFKRSKEDPEVRKFAALLPDPFEL